MEEIRKKTKNFLSHKRKSIEIKNERISLIKPVFNNIEATKSNKFNLNEQKENICDENKKINCEKCGQKNYLLFFNSCQGILEYLFSLKMRNALLKNAKIFRKYLQLQYNKPRKICSDCLLKILNSQSELEYFIKKNELNNDPFDGLFNNVNLKYFNNKEIPEKKIFLNKKISNQNQVLNSNINNLNNAFPNFNPNHNLIIGYLNPSNNQFVPCNNYNYFANQDTFNENFNINNINQNLPLQSYLLNYQNYSQNSNLNQPAKIILPNNDNISNLNNFPVTSELNENDMNSNSNYNSNSNSNSNKENSISNSSGYVKIKNKDFDELFNVISECYHKLLDIKNNSDLNSNLKESSQEQDNNNDQINDINFNTENSEINNKSKE